MFLLQLFWLNFLFRKCFPIFLPTEFYISLCLSLFVFYYFSLYFHFWLKFRFKRNTCLKKIFIFLHIYTDTRFSSSLFISWITKNQLLNSIFPFHTHTSTHLHTPKPQHSMNGFNWLTQKCRKFSSIRPLRYILLLGLAIQCKYAWPCQFFDEYKNGDKEKKKHTHISPLGWLKQYNKSLNSCIIRWGLQKAYDKQRNTPTEKKWNAQHTKSNQVWLLYDACVFQLSSKFASLILLFFSFPPIFRLFFSVVCKFYSLSASSMFVFSRRWLWMSFAIHWWIPRNGGDDTTGILYLQVAKIHHI